MRINSKYLYAFAGLMLGLTACNSDDLTSPAEVTTGKSVHVTLTVDRSNVSSRTVVDENADGITLYSKWVDGDKLLVVTANQEVGELTLSSGAGTSEGVFSGELVVDVDAEYTVWYLGGSNAGEGAYAYWDKNQNKVVNPLVDASEFEISGDIDDLCRADLMKHEGVKFTIAGGKAYSTASVTLEALNAMAHFKVTGYPASLERAEMIATFGDQSYKVTNLVENVYLPLVPGKYAPVFTLSTSDNKTYKYTFANETEVVAGLYYKAENGTEVTGIPVQLTEVAPPEPPYDPANDPDLIGNVFEVNGKKFRFTKGNLKYNTETGEWSLMDHQYDFICKAGWTTSDGKWQKTKETEIDLFGFGATGLYDIESDQTAQVPEFWKQTADQTYTNASFYYPTNDLETNKGQGTTGSYLEHGIKYTNFDWGKAYYLYKNEEAYPTADAPYTSYDWAIDPSHKDGDPEALRYFTLSSNDWTNLQSKYFMCGVTITGITNPVNTTAKNNIYGCLIFPITGEGANSAEVNKDKLAKVKALLAGHYTYLSTSLTTNLNFTGNNYQYFNYSWLKITKDHFEALEKLGVVFLPEAGHRATNSYTKNDGYYWTSTALQDSNAVPFNFDGDSSPKVFKLNTQHGRILASAVRLVKEVPADYTDPMVVE